MKPKSQIILDKALQTEFKTTIELFDKFVDYLNSLDYKTKFSKGFGGRIGESTTASQSRHPFEHEEIAPSEISNVVELRKKLVGSVNCIKKDIDCVNSRNMS